MKRFIGGILFFVVIVALVGCNSTTKQSQFGREESVDAGISPHDMNTEIQQNISMDGLSIAIVTSPSPVTDGCFNQASYDGILAYIKQFPNAQITPIRETSGLNEFSVDMVEQISNNYDVIVCSGYEFAGVGEVALKHKNTKYIIVDSFPQNSNGEVLQMDNVYGMQFKEEQGGFLAGIVAASETKTNKVAEINGIAVPSNCSYQLGFEAGIKYSNQKYGTEASYIELKEYSGTDINGIDVGGNYVNSFNDEFIAKEITYMLIDEGIDVIFPAAGSSGNGVFTVVKNNPSCSIIGVDVDQSYLGETQKGNIVITSVIKNITLNVYEQLIEIANGEFEGKNETLGVDTNSIYAITDEKSTNMSDLTRKRLEEVQRLLLERKIIVPSFYNDYTITNFPGYGGGQYEEN